jgi:hypothetical protein
VWHDVPLIPQQSDNTCWAASMAMLVQYLFNASRGISLTQQSTSPFAPVFTPRGVAQAAGPRLLAAYDRNLQITDVIQDNFRDLAHPWGLTTTFDFTNPSPADWDRLLTQFGPFYVLLSRGASDHAVIACGINQDQLGIVDPSPIGSGERYTIRVNSIYSYPVAIHGGPGSDVLSQTRGGR